MRINLLQTMCATLTLAVCAPSFAAEVYKSAMFDFSVEQIISELKSANLQLNGASTVLYCQSEIDIKGVAARTHCYDKEENEGLVDLAEKTIAGLSFTPAEVDGQAVPVRMSYRVGFNANNESIDAVLIPNLGSMQERYGRDYVAPQERLDVSDWYDRYNKNSWVNGEVFLGKGEMSRVAATINKDGKTDVVRTLDTERAYKRDANIVKSALKKSRFIPGFVDGNPVPMGYLAVVNYGGDSGEAVSKR